MLPTVTPYLLRMCRSVDALRRLVILLVLAALAPALRAGAAGSSAAKRSYDIPAGDAATTLQQFVDQSGEQVIYVVPKVRGVRTNPVKGKLTARETLDRMVANTDLVVVQDEKTSALVVNRTVRPRPDSPPSNSTSRRETTSTEPPDNMKRKNPIALLTAWVAVAFAPMHAAEAGKEPATTVGMADRVIELSPFEVTADPKDSYDALNTNSITGTNLSLAQLPITAEIFTETAMSDLAVNSVLELLNTHAVGIVQNTIGSADAGEGQLPGDRIVGNFAMRGITTGRVRREGLFDSGGFLMDSYNT